MDVSACVSWERECVCESVWGGQASKVRMMCMMWCMRHHCLVFARKEKQTDICQPVSPSFRTPPTSFANKGVFICEHLRALPRKRRMEGLQRVAHLRTLPPTTLLLHRPLHRVISARPQGRQGLCDSYDCRETSGRTRSPKG